MSASSFIAAAAAGGAIAVAATTVRLPRSPRLRPLRGARNLGRPSDPGSNASATAERFATPPEFVVHAVSNAALPLDPASAFRIWASALVATLAGAVVLSLSPLVPLIVAAGPPIALLALRNRRATLRRRHLPVALDSVASSLRSGRSVAAAMAAMGTDGATGPIPLGRGPLEEEFAGVAARSDAGRPLAQVIAEWARSAETDADTRLAGAALATAAELGGPAATALETTAQSLRDRADSDGVVEALSVQARMSAWLLTLAPLAFAGLISGIDPESGEFLFGSPLGWLCVGAGLGLDAIGALWMHRMVRKAAR